MNTVMPKTKTALLPYVSHIVDDALGNGLFKTADEFRAKMQRNPELLPLARFVGWQCGFEPMIVAVVSYLPGITPDADIACELAEDYMREQHLSWFADPTNTEPDFVL